MFTTELSVTDKKFGNGLAAWPKETREIKCSAFIQWKTKFNGKK